MSISFLYTIECYMLTIWKWQKKVFFDQVPTKMLHVDNFDFAYSSVIILWNILGTSW